MIAETQSYIFRRRSRFRRRRGCLSSLLKLPYVKERCTLMRAARAARLFFSPSTNHIIDLLRRRYTCSTIIFSRSTNSVSLIYGVFVAVAVLASQTPY